MRPARTILIMQLSNSRDIGSRPGKYQGTPMLSIPLKHGLPYQGSSCLYFRPVIKSHL